MVMKQISYLLVIGSLSLISYEKYLIASLGGPYMDLKSKLSKDNIKKTREELAQPAEQLTQGPNVLDQTVDFLMKHEGYRPNVYKDTSNIDTIGVGSNISSPATQKAAKSLDLDTEQMRASQSSLSPEQSRMLARKTLEVKYPEFETIRNRDFPEAQLDPNREAALLSMYYNNPKLIGPMLRNKLAANDVPGVVREMVLRSNKDRVPGIAKRRLEEARLFAGEEFDSIMESFTPKERQYLSEVLGKIKNPHEKMRVLEEYAKYIK
jgi:GH24 family phage-related lysozyme (muramidase)